MERPGEQSCPIATLDEILTDAKGAVAESGMLRKLPG